MSNKVVIVTGANTGIGKEAARGLAKMGAHVILACRNLEAADSAALEIKGDIRNSKGKVETMKLDLASFTSIRSFVQDFEKKNLPLHVLLNNAGVWTDNSQRTADGLATVIGINHFGTFLLTNLLLPNLKKTKGRIVTVSSSAYKTGKIVYDDLDLKSVPGYTSAPYYTSKLANILFTQTLSDKLKGTGVTANCLNPKLVKSDLFRSAHLLPSRVLANILGVLLNVVGMSPWQGAQTSIYLASSPEVEGVSGKYFEYCRDTPVVHPQFKDNTREMLWQESLKVVRLPEW